eukprot:3938706-Rhodomonas_salina.5
MSAETRVCSMMSAETRVSTAATSVSDALAGSLCIACPPGTNPRLLLFPSTGLLVPSTGHEYWSTDAQYWSSHAWLVNAPLHLLPPATRPRPYTLY